MRLDARNWLGICLGVLWSLALLEFYGLMSSGIPISYLSTLATGIVIGFEFCVIFIKKNKIKVIQMLKKELKREAEIKELGLYG